MTRKPLPKAIIQPLAGSRTGTAAGSSGQTVRRSAALAHDAAEPEPALAVSAAPIANDPLPALSPEAQQLAAKRLALARKIVARHWTYAAAGGLVPLPIVNVAGVTTVILRMLKQLSELYGVPFERDRTRSIILGLMGGATPTGLGVTTAATLAFAIPGPALAGLAVSALTAGALTNGIGRVYIEQFEAASR